MNEHPNIVKLNLKDLEALRRISIDTFYESFRESNSEENMQDYINKFFSGEKIEAELKNPGSSFYFAMINGEPAGYLKLNTGQAQTELKDKNGIEIERIYVKREAQGKRIGQVLFDKAMEIAGDNNYDYLWLGVWEKNPGAIRFYERNGLKQFSSHTFKLGDDIQTDIMMRIDLKPTV